MSYDLHFWRQSPEFSLSPEETLDQICNEEPIEGIEEFSKETIINLFKTNFSDIQDNGLELDWEGDGSYFQVSFLHTSSTQINGFTVNCGYKLLDNPDSINLIIEFASEEGMALYDPQSGERYQQTK